MKQCSKCGTTKPFTEFGQSNPTKKDGHNSWCLQCCRDASRRHRETASGIYSAIKGRCTFYETHEGSNRNAKPLNMTREEFIPWYHSQIKECGYCSIPEEHIHIIEKDFGRHSIRLEIDCKDNDTGYATDNLILSCRRCNFIKSNYFNYDEMRVIGQEVIKSKWELELHTTKNGGEE